MRAMPRVLAALLAAVLMVGAPSGAVADSGPDVGPNKAMFSDNGAPAGPYGPIQYSFLDASLAVQRQSAMVPSGANDWSCVPAAGEEPVILIPGTGESAYATWAFYGPKLKAAGKCVYTFEYNPALMNGQNHPRLEWLQQAGDIRQTAVALGAFTQRVLAATGAQKVDYVGHSQGGGPLPLWYMNKMDGAQYVDQLIGLVPSHRGTQPLGIDRFVDAISLRFPIENLAAQFNGDAWPQQLAGSQLNQELYMNGPITRPGVRYMVLSTRFDEVVMPNTNSFIHEPGVENILIQDICPLDFSDHFGFAYDPIAYQLVENALTGRSIPPRCVYVRPFHQ